MKKNKEECRLQQSDYDLKQFSIRDEANNGFHYFKYHQEEISLKKAIEEYKRQKLNYKLPVVLGLNYKDEIEFADLVDLKHILMAGQTGSGKSMLQHTILYMLLSLMPNEIKLFLVDVKRIDLVLYKEIPQLITEVITKSEDCFSKIEQLIKEKNRRLKLWNRHKKHPYIITIIDTISDLVLSDRQRFDNLMSKLMDNAIEAKIHVIISDSRICPEIFTPAVRSLFPTKICFAVPTNEYPELIINSNLGMYLYGRGDMLFLPSNQNILTRIQAPFVENNETNNLIDYLKNNTSKDDYEEHLFLKEKNLKISNHSKLPKDEFFPEAVELVRKSGTISPDKIMRHFKVSYARARRLIDELEEAGILEPSDSSSEPGKVLIKHENDYSVWKNSSNR